MSASADALLTKTDAELQFFVANPEYYQPELVLAAQRELKRRGVRPAVADAAATTDFAADYFDEPARPRPWLVPLLLVLAVAALGLGVAWYRADTRAQASLAARSAARLSPDSLKLESVEAQALPTANTDRYIAQQLAIVPAAERRQATAQQMQQYRGVSRRFWQAEYPTEFVIGLAAAGKTPPNYPLFVGQIQLLEQQWHTSGNALVYTYHFPPTMADQIARMRSAAALERKILENLKAQAALGEPLHLSDKDRMDYATAQELLHDVTHRLGPLKAH